MSGLSHHPNHLELIRHSMAHVMAAAVQEMFPEAQFGVGPVVENGMYYDFILPRTLIPEDLPLIEKKMRSLVQRKLAIKRDVVTMEEALALFTRLKQPLKLELLSDLATKGTTKLDATDLAIVDEASGVPEITVYRIVDEETGEVLFEDLCRGPHVEDLKVLRSVGFKLDKFSAAYWRGDQARNISMQRLYGLVFENQTALEDFLKQREEAKLRDHRLLGQQLELFITVDDVGAGLPIYLPRGAKLRQILERYMLERQEERGYQYVYTPHIGKEDLFRKSGHLDHYADGMYSPIVMNNLKGEGDGDKFYLKPMNCPMHHYVYLSKQRSYRDLPVKLMEYGTVYRYEESGVLTGLIRVRGFTQNDAHVYCREDQVQEILMESIQDFDRAYKEIGITDYKFRLSLPDFENNREKYGEENDEWRRGIAAIKAAAEQSGVEYFEAKNEAAFYGPKIDVQVRNVNGKEDTLSTIQIDFSIAEKFGITFVDSDGSDKVPAIMHRAFMGSIDRFMAFLIEQTGGWFPLWLAPEQVRVLTVNNEQATLDYVEMIKKTLNQITLNKPLKHNDLRYTVDTRNESLGKKLKEAILFKIPLIIIVGPKDIEAGEITVKTHQEEKKIKFGELRNFVEGV